MAYGETGAATLRQRSLGDQDPAIALARLQQKLRDEAERNLAFAQQGDPHFSTGATAADVRGYDEDLAANPYSDANMAKRSQATQATDQMVQTANQLLASGLSASELEAQIPMQMARLDQQLNDSMIKAISGFAAAINGGTKMAA